MDGYVTYQLRSKCGDGDEYDYFIQIDSSVLEDIFNHIMEHELNIDKHNLVRCTVVEEECNHLIPEELRKVG
jgi:hypothetical protein